MARTGNGHFEVQGKSAKGKEEWVKFDIVQQTAVSNQQLSKASAAQPSIAAQGNTHPTTARLQVESNPSGADIEIDGSFVGNTPSDLQILEGEHTVVIKKAGFTDWKRKIEVNSGSSVHLSAELGKAENP